MSPTRKTTPSPDAPTKLFSDESDPLLDAVQGIARRLIALTASALLQVERSRRRQVTLPEYRVLVLIALGGISRPSELAQELEVTRPAVAQILGRLRRKGLVTQRPGSDRRQSILSVTRAGQTVVDSVVHERARRLHPVIGSLSARERAELLDALQRFDGALAKVRP